jgi:hypothetical protein
VLLFLLCFSALNIIVKSAASSDNQSASAAESSQNVLCSSPHSLHAYGTRTCPWAAETRFSAPHFAHLLSIRVLPCLMVMALRSNASFTKRSVSSRIACFDISRFLVFCAIGHTAGRGPRQRTCWVTIVLIDVLLGHRRLMLPGHWRAWQPEPALHQPQARGGSSISTNLQRKLGYSRRPAAACLARACGPHLTVFGR